jgi:hypothetical protein
MLVFRIHISVRDRSLTFFLSCSCSERAAPEAWTCKVVEADADSRTCRIGETAGFIVEGGLECGVGTGIGLEGSEA